MTTYVFTSICLNYIPKARVLAQSIKKYHPDVKFCVALAETTTEDLLSLEPAFDEIITIDQLGIPDLDRWAFQHELVEVSTGIKGFVLAHLLARTDCLRVIYFDPDIVIFNKLFPIYDALIQHQIVLTPHLTRPARSKAGLKDHEKASLKYGVYNLGFIAVANRHEGRAFAGWWRSRLYQYCYDDIAEGLFTDQRWADLVPAFFSSTGILRHPGCNVATWNLEDRQVKGDFENGFTCNGEKLIFYHFSGFDSGAQLEQLQIYAADMPAAYLLRNWYIKTCATNDPRNYASVPWKYSRFDNSMPVTKDHRSLYRQRRDLQRAFPKPFDTKNPENSYYHWYESTYNIKTSSAAEPSQLHHFNFHDGYGRLLTPLERYLTDPKLFHIRTSPDFDGESYSAQHPEIIAQNKNPLLHYVKAHHGAEAASPTSTLTNATAKRGPFSPLMTPWQIDCPTILFVSHWGGGGTEIHMERIAGLLHQQANFLLLYPSLQQGKLILRNLNGNDAASMSFMIDDGLDAIIDAINSIGIDRIHIHHLLGNETYLRELIGTLKVPFDLTLHDYYLLSPSPQLCDQQGRFVGEDLLQAENALSYAVETAKAGSLRQWADSHGWLLNEAERIFAPSEDTARRFERLKPGIRVQAVPHPETPRPEITPIEVRPLTEEAPLKILLLGHLSLHKGAVLVDTCAKLAKGQKLPLEFHVAGSMPKLATHPASQLWNHGEYRADDVQVKIKAIAPHLAWFPILWPETYCYALSEAMQAGLPVAATKIGAVADRLVGRPLTWLQDWQTSAEDWIKTLLSIREVLRQKNGVIEFFDAKVLDGTAFYRSAYLEPALQRFILRQQSATGQIPTSIGRAQLA